MSTNTDFMRSSRWMTWSNLVTTLRLVSAIVILFAFADKSYGLAFCIFIFAGLTDVIDGYLARILDDQTTLGILLDPIADKIFLLSMFSAFTFFDIPFLKLPVWFWILVVGREILMVSGALLLLGKGKASQIRPLLWGKLTTFFQLFFLCWIFICGFVGWNPIKTYATAMLLLAIFSIISLIQYGKEALKIATEKNKSKEVS